MHMKLIPLASLLSGVLVLSSAPTATAAVNLVQNGSFETTQLAPSGQLNYNTIATGWSTTGYNMLFTPGSANSPGVASQYGTVTLQGPVPATSPDGGNFVGADAADQVGAINQTITGLVVGRPYALSFYWGGVEEAPDHIGTTEKWTVSLGAQTQSTTQVVVPANSFSGWQQAHFIYTATSTSEVLSFLASGNPSGQPPFALLDGVTLIAPVPEPSTLLAGASAVLLLVGGGARRMVRKQTEV